MTNDRTGLITIAEHKSQLPEEAARTLFLLAAAVSARGGGPVTVSPDTVVVVTPATPITLTIKGGFTDEYNPQRDLDATLKRPTKRPGTVI
ncbi:hypothetical protein [Leifsonia virtsii]|uniref:Uncharacterized protein n=1 Tax=Leifsonia virtsii TaxID=3035915 RepID=A0ABT8ISX5_9MICO|nr:hypothetical protein [Leifsonia virtsii]MDN4595905.1 hypothetical protein [Leifsonia virtsii]